MRESRGMVLKLPQECFIMSEEEAAYIEGGLTIGYSSDMCTKKGAIKAATKVRNTYGWRNISVDDLAAEIFSHAFAYYKAGDFISIAAGLGITPVQSIQQSLSNGIDIENGLDMAVFAGRPRYEWYRKIYQFAS